MDTQVKLYPRCLMHKKHNVFLGPDGYLRPCCYVNNSRDWNEFLIWIQNNDLNIEDLRLWNSDLMQLKSSPTWTLLKKQLESQDPNCPTICKKMCSEPTTPNLHSKIDNPS